MKALHGLLAVVLAGALTGRGAAEPGAWERVGKAGDWKGTIVGTVLNGQIYTVEDSGSLYVTNPATGEWKALGKAEFANTRFLFAEGRSLYSIEKDGSLYVISPADGSWKQVGDAGAWKATIAGVVLGNRLYTVEENGGLYTTDPTTGKWQQLGKAEFANTRFLFAAGQGLYSIEKDGSLYAISPADGSWKQVGEAGAWKNTQAGSAAGGHLYTTESSGNLYQTDLTSGEWKQLGKADFAATRFMFTAGTGLATIEEDGSLYAVAIK